MNCIYKDDKKCKILRNQKCTDCKFSRTPEQDEARKLKHDIRLNHLPAKKQRYIADKYYGGEWIWQM